MNARGVIFIVAGILLGVFVLANWTLLAASVDLNVLIARVHAPLGILILLIAAVIFLVDLAAHALTRRNWVRERQALGKDLEQARLRTEREEESRTAALRATVERELTTIRGQLDQLLAGQAALLGQRAPRSPEPGGERSLRLTKP